MSYDVAPSVDSQLAAIATFIRRDNPDAARRFLEAVYGDFDFVGAWPKASPLARFRNPSLRNVRYRPVRRPFQNYLIFYRIESEYVLIGSVLWGGMNWTDDLNVF